MSQLSSKLDFFQESVIREMTRKAIHHDAINLSQGMPDYSPPEELITGLLKAMKEEIHQYSITYGRYDLRKKIADKFRNYNKIKLDPEHEITVTCGASEALSSSILAVTDPKDEILILEPWYENYVPLTHLAEGKPIFVPLSSDDFSLDQEKMLEKTTEKTKAIIINSPHNPTGKVFTKDELKFISDLCVDNDLIAITDEIYEYILFDGKKHVSLASISDMFDRTITVSGFSKTYSITGWRVGYVGADIDIMTGIRKVHDYLTVCAPSFLQYAVLKAFDLQKEYFAELIKRYQENRDFLVSELEKLGFNVIIPAGAYYLFADISDFKMSDKTFVNFLVEEKGVATVPGSSFYQKDSRTSKEGERFVRFTFSHKIETLEKAITRIKRKIEKM
ncbi:MAG: pyridoxal phosphate-dependent aminotransferase [Candidatus Heimdallarchaeota archaeon]|nr:pyridoxal phosphate-dependent aminotransferase [Candidatus Heimdallarchaeota archaeon]MCK4955825.1 pyridoxal phosphate-dependent aminotransferase [Candidatus Heimdallarchaeota archaeon]